MEEIIGENVKIEKKSVFFFFFFFFFFGILSYTEAQHKINNLFFIFFFFFFIFSFLLFL
jgi:hypothetical protein